MAPGPNRRTLLSAATGLAATVLAGCTETPATGTPGDASPGSGGSALFDPDDLVSATHDGFLAVDGAAYRQGTGALPPAFTEGIASMAERHGLRISDVDRFWALGGFDRADPDSYRDDRLLLSAVVTGSVDPDASASAVREHEDVSEVGTHEGATVYARSSDYDEGRSRAYAVSDEAVVGAVVDNGRAVRRARERVTATAREQAEGGGTPTPENGNDGTPTPESGADVVSTAAGPGDGATARMAVERHFDALAGGAGYPGVETLLEDPTAPLAAGARVDGDALRDALLREPKSDVEKSAAAVLTGLRTVGLTGSMSPDAEPPASLSIDLSYGSGDDASATTVDSLVTALREASDSAKAALEHVDVGAAADGDTVTVDVGADPEAAFRAFTEPRGEVAPRAPQASFTFAVETDDRVTVTHDGGDAVRGVTVRYTADGSRVQERWTGGEDGVTAGDAYTTERAPDSGTALRVVWESDDGSSAATLAKFEAPE